MTNLHFDRILCSEEAIDIKMGESMETSSASNIGGCEGPEAMYVKLISSDDHEFVVKREHALTSGTIKVSNSL